MLWRIHSLAAFIGLLPAFAAPNTGIIQVTGVRSWSHTDSTRVIVETTGRADFRTDSAHNPERLFLDVLRSRPSAIERRGVAHQVNDRLLKRVRVAETIPGTTRIVFDLTAAADLRISRLDTPDRLVIELRPMRAPLHPTLTASTTSLSASSPVASPITPLPARRFVYPVPAPRRPIYIPPPLQLYITAVDWQVPYAALLIRPLGSANLPKQFKVRPAAAPVTTTEVLPATHPATVDSTPLPSENASRSLTRALGLKVGRIVIDAGHGGHDDGTIGPHGVLEKDVVLDVALRLSKIVQERMGAEVVLTRSDDTFIPLHERTQIANDRKADLFLSIHANSSPSPEVTGTETFFLNFASNSSALDVAARENAGADKNLGELKDLIQSITLNDKIEESHTFAQTVQNSLQAQALKTNAAAHNRGVKRAPFVVLIGASMPSILAEIGFLSNERDERNLGKSEYRQKIAEALYKGLNEYSQSLSHYDVSRTMAVSSTGLAH